MKPLILFFLFLAVNLNAQEEVFQVDHNINSEAFGVDRKITVYLPSTYYKYPEDSFTVIYMLDGHYKPFADMGAQIIDYGVRNKMYLPSIVVGIHQQNRGWEFSEPIDDSEKEDYNKGRAPELRKHLEQEVFPLIALQYPRIKSFKTLIGHSSGGAFVLNTLFTDERNLFDAYIAISPAIRTGETNIMERVSNKLKEGQSFSNYLYCSSGDIGEREELFGGAVRRLDSILLQYPNHGLAWNMSQFKDTDHWSCVAPSFNDGMLRLNRTFRVDEKMFIDFAKNTPESMRDQIAKFYDSVSSQYGYHEYPSAGTIKNIAWEISEKGFQQAALEMYDFGIEIYPANFTLTRAKAKHLVKMDRNKEALLLFEECKILLETIKEKMSAEDYDWYVEDFETRISKLK